MCEGRARRGVFPDKGGGVRYDRKTGLGHLLSSHGAGGGEQKHMPAAARGARCSCATGRYLARATTARRAASAHCEAVGCLREQLGIASGERHEICRGSHAEINAIAQAAAAGTSTAGSWLYCTHEPCVYCTKALINAGCEKVFYLYPYPDELAARHHGGGREWKASGSTPRRCRAIFFRFNRADGGRAGRPGEGS